MRLSSIKLAGFKSFVDPTNFHVPGQLVGIVGPNGCGKSNIIDAVRWVLGESRAAELRGESMQDVIFNGSTQRKPAGRASVELVFDNAEGRAAGQWSQYAEVAVKRVLSRDGTSSYFINNQAVRRRDIQDIFLGTGLGPRAYAIIGQGMISRIIEAKPDDMRIFLEEAAGVSKYKERRRETENRLSDTRENLTRVEDILRELNSNLEKLEKQAEVAQRYHSLQNDVTLNGTVQVANLGGNLLLVALGGEPMADYALRLRRELAAPGRAVWVAGYSNLVSCYVPTRKVLEEGGYEGTEAVIYQSLPGPFRAEIEESIIATALRQAAATSKNR